jgi:hypothetical protein
MWRSLVAHLTGGQGAAGSNPVIPTGTKQQVRGRFGEIRDGLFRVLSRPHPQSERPIMAHSARSIKDRHMDSIHPLCDTIADTGRRHAPCPVVVVAAVRVSDSLARALPTVPALFPGRSASSAVALICDKVGRCSRTAGLSG